MTEKRILLVEDDPSDLDLILRSLPEALRPQLDVLRDGQDALEYLLRQGRHARRAHDPALVFLDLRLPLHNGEELLRVIRELEAMREVPVIIFTNSVDTVERDRCLALGATEFVTKPFRVQDFITTFFGLFTKWLEAPLPRRADASNTTVPQ